MKFRICLSLLIIFLGFSNANSQTRERDSTYKKFFIGSTLFVLGNIIPNDSNPPDFIQHNFGYRLTPKDVISIEAKTLKYAYPLGIPYGISIHLFKWNRTHHL